VERGPGRSLHCDRRALEVGPDDTRRHDAPSIGRGRAAAERRLDENPPRRTHGVDVPDRRGGRGRRRPGHHAPPRWTAAG